MVAIGSRAKRSVQDHYLIAMNGDSRKPEIAAVQNYFAVTTRAHEMHQLCQEREARIHIRLENELLPFLEEHTDGYLRSAECSFCCNPTPSKTPASPLC